MQIPTTVVFHLVVFFRQTLFSLARSLQSVLVEKYEWGEEDADELSSFLLPMLDFVQENRATAAQCLEHPWLSDA